MISRTLINVLPEREPPESKINVAGLACSLVASFCFVVLIKPFAITQPDQNQISFVKTAFHSRNLPLQPTRISSSQTAYHNPSSSLSITTRATPPLTSPDRLVSVLFFHLSDFLLFNQYLIAWMFGSW